MAKCIRLRSHAVYSVEEGRAREKTGLSRLKLKESTKWPRTEIQVGYNLYPTWNYCFNRDKRLPIPCLPAITKTTSSCFSWNSESAYGLQSLNIDSFLLWRIISVGAINEITQDRRLGLFRCSMCRSRGFLTQRVFCPSATAIELRLWGGLFSRARMGIQVRFGWHSLERITFSVNDFFVVAVEEELVVLEVYDVECAAKFV